jgi:anti-sigma regulatory factor (Ser/Thr protein kinase)
MEQSLNLNADLAAARVLRQAVIALCEQAQADEAAIGDFALAVSEAFSNAVRHGVGARQASIEAVVEVSGEGVRVCLRYPGEPFALDEPCLPAPDSTGGRGRFLMSILTDRVHYQFDRGMTQATLIKQWR